MSNDRGVFTLGAYRRAQVEGQGVDLNDVWLPQEASKYGYMGGGYAGGDITIVDKITFDTDTIARSPSANLPANVSSTGSFSSPSAGFILGGNEGPSPFPSSQSSVRKLTYATDIFSINPSPVNYGTGQSYTNIMGAASPTYGYIAGGQIDGSYSGNRTRRMSLATETWSVLRDGSGTNLSSQMENIGQAIGNQEAGYWCGSNPGGGRSRIHKITYSTETGSTAGVISGYPSSKGRSNMASVGNANNGYLIGGVSAGPGPAPISTIHRVTYATDTAVVIPAQLPVATNSIEGTGNVSKGYIGGGTNPGNTPSINSAVWKLDMNTETVSTLSSSRSVANHSIAAVSATDNASKINTEQERWTDGFKEDDLKAGYYQGGGNPSSNSATQKVSFITDQASLAPGANLPQNGSAFAGVNSNSTKTIISGGEPGGEGFMKFVYSTETSSNLAGSMPSKRWLNNDMGYGTESLGYVTGGMSEPSNPGFYYSSTQKIEYATDTTSDVPGANAHQPLREMGAFGNTDHTLGYIVGGIIKSPTNAVSRVQKMTYSTETIANTPANMPNNYFNLGTTTGPDAGYIYSKQEYPGYDANGSVQKFVYATDSMTTVPQPSYYPSYGANGTGNSTNGYYGGGRGGPTHRYTRIFKLNFSTGILQQIPSSFSLPSGVYRSAASSAVSRKKSPKGAPVPTPTPGYDPGNYELAAGVPNHGYYMGGNGPNSYGSTNSMKMNFATDTLSTGVQLSEKYRSGTQGSGGKTASSPSHAYVIQGLAPSNTGNTYVRKIQYSNDTGSNAPNTPSQPSWGSAIAGRTTNLYKAGGHDHANIPLQTRTGILKLTYASDTWNQISQGNAGYSNPSGWPRQSFASGGTQEYALWSQSSPNDYRSSISKFTYATDTGVMNIPGATYPNTEQTLQVGNSNDTHWYMARGNTPSGPFQSKISKFTFSTDTWEFGTLTDSTYDYGSATGSAAINNGMFAGYWAGGHYDQQDATSTMKLTYSSETVAKGPNIPSGRYSPSASSGGGGAEFTGTSVQEWGHGGTRVPNVV